ncbi:FlgK family flagellar hook-associated protein [Pseudoalteromonas spongiae]|uniref:FlgK family flagellar hook-associated protein n=1 Tax=Pseudoalteromonas spongiae TaxID=298657 RepID=UPI00110B7C94|nr:flagellar basal body rod C-terminal domain-containing protein [Pseudoalteromonas spongiae]TMO82616.1 flagellar biosynthesis protein FlgK [Pseudoalteromonas spongiae]
MSFNLLNIANSGVRASSELLQTTSKNITNVNTEGYVRERTEHRTLFDNQVGLGQTFRLVNDFAQQQLNRDVSNLAFFNQFVDESARVDSLFAEESNSLSTSINSLFSSLQETLNQPSSSVSRNLFFNDAQGYIDQLGRLSGIVFDQKTIVNDQLEIYTDEANGLINKISELNLAIASGSSGPDGSALNSTINQRDLAIKELAEYIDIETLDGPNGEKLVFMGTGEAVVMEDGAFNLFSLSGDPDPNFKDLKLDVDSGKAIPLEVDTSLLKGKIGGLLAYREDILIPSQNKLGQLSLAMADAFNQQNRLGLDADGELGGDLFTIPSAGAYAYAANTGTAQVTGTIEAGHGSEIPASDFLIEYTAANQITVSALDKYGDPVGTPIVATLAGGVANAGSAGGFLYGLEINLTAGAAVGDKFELKLNSEASTNIQLATNRPEDLALASPIRTNSNINNQGTGSISGGTVTDTTAAGFTAGPPPSLTNGPITITKTANPNEFDITDGTPAVTTTVVLTPPYDNVLNQAGAPYNTYGFDFSLEGAPNTGDSFTVEFNTNGFDDNRNGLMLAGLQDKELVRANIETSAGGDNLTTLNEAYGNLITDVGIRTSSAKTNQVAFEALANQSNAWYESISGVNLDEEAANLLRFQQSYSAAAQILSTARTVFDTILNAAR